MKGGNYSEDQIGNSTPSHLRAAYIEGKRSGETIVNTWARINGTTGFIFRLALAHGPGSGLNDERVLNTFVKSAIKEKKIKMKDKGNAIRTYCSSRDAVLLTLGAIMGGQTGTYNIGGKARVTIKELALCIGKMLDAEVEVPENNQSYLEEAPEEVSLNLEKVLSTVNNFEFDSLETGLEITTNWYRQIMT